MERARVTNQLDLDKPTPVNIRIDNIFELAGQRLNRYPYQEKYQSLLNEIKS